MTQVHPMVHDEIEQALDRVAGVQHDLDSACFYLQRQFNIETGDGAGYFFSGVADVWAQIDAGGQRKSLQDWLIWELGMQS